MGTRGSALDYEGSYEEDGDHYPSIHDVDGYEGVLGCNRVSYCFDLALTGAVRTVPPRRAACLHCVKNLSIDPARECPSIENAATGSVIYRNLPFIPLALLVQELASVDDSSFPTTRPSFSPFNPMMKSSDIEKGVWKDDMSMGTESAVLGLVLEMYRRIKLEVIVELPMLKQRWKIIVFGIIMHPGFHCRTNSPTATRPWPEDWTGHVVIDVQNGVSKGCGDLIFSSHTIFMLTGILAYTEYGNRFFLKCAAWICGAIISILIVASRKHYTVDIVIAWYTVPMVFWTLYRRWTTHRPMSELLGAFGEFDEPDPQMPGQANRTNVAIEFLNDSDHEGTEMLLRGNRSSQAESSSTASSTSAPQNPPSRGRNSQSDDESKAPSQWGASGQGQAGNVGGLMSGLKTLNKAGGGGGGGNAGGGAGGGGSSTTVPRSRSTATNLAGTGDAEERSVNGLQQQPGCHVS
eukprot:gene5996-5287_t